MLSEDVSNKKIFNAKLHSKIDLFWNIFVSTLDIVKEGLKMTLYITIYVLHTDLLGVIFEFLTFSRLWGTNSLFEGEAPLEFTETFSIINSYAHLTKHTKFQFSENVCIYFSWFHWTNWQSFLRLKRKKKKKKINISELLIQFCQLSRFFCFCQLRNWYVWGGGGKLLHNPFAIRQARWSSYIRICTFWNHKPVSGRPNQ